MIIIHITITSSIPMLKHSFMDTCISSFIELNFDYLKLYILLHCGWLEWIHGYPDHYTWGEHSDWLFFLYPLILELTLMQTQNTWNQNCNKMVVDKCLALCYQLFRLIECRMICKNTKAACINIYCSSLQQKVPDKHDWQYIGGCTLLRLHVNERTF